MTKKKYNGWTNYETWVVNLWMGNDQGSQTFWDEVTKDVLQNAEKDKTFSKEERARIDLSVTLKEHFDDNVPGDTTLGYSGVYADLLNGALSEVNWHEIAGHLIEATVETVPA